jgi:hypothetical protein
MTSTMATPNKLHRSWKDAERKGQAQSQAEVLQWINTFRRVGIVIPLSMNVPEKREFPRETGRAGSEAHLATTLNAQVYTQVLLPLLG